MEAMASTLGEERVERRVSRCDTVGARGRGDGLLEVLLELVRVVGGVDREDDRVREAESLETEMLRDHDVASKAGIAVELLPPLGVEY